MSRDLDFMEHADGEAETELAGGGQAKVDAIHEMSDLVRGHLELSADDVPEAKFAAMWREIDKSITNAEPAAEPVRAKPGLFRKISRFFDLYRSQIITGAVSAGAVAALALVLRTTGDSGTHSRGSDPIDVRPVVHRPAEIEDLDTPDGTSNVFNIDDEDGSTTVIWVTPQDTVEGI
ncbi:MAG: hypothetical protein QM831_07915 [Kofleriaceae bacterium]